MPGFVAKTQTRDPRVLASAGPSVKPNKRWLRHPSAMQTLCLHRCSP